MHCFLPLHSVDCISAVGRSRRPHCQLRPKILSGHRIRALQDCLGRRHFRTPLRNEVGNPYVARSVSRSAGRSIHSIGRGRPAPTRSLVSADGSSRLSRPASKRSLSRAAIGQKAAARERLLRRLRCCPQPAHSPRRTCGSHRNARARCITRRLREPQQRRRLRFRPPSGSASSNAAPPVRRSFGP